MLFSNKSIFQNFCYLHKFNTCTNRLWDTRIFPCHIWIFLSCYKYKIKIIIIYGIIVGKSSLWFFLFSQSFMLHHWINYSLCLGSLGLHLVNLDNLIVWLHANSRQWAIAFIPALVLFLRITWLQTHFSQYLPMNRVFSLLYCDIK